MLTKSRIKNVNPLQLGIVMGALYGALGLIVALLMLPFAGMMAAISHTSAGGRMWITSIFLFPIVYGVLGFLSGMLMAFIYNLVAGFTGGVEITSESVGSTAAMATV